MKRFHGLVRARGYGLKSISFQAKLTAIAVNLKRIAALVVERTAISFTHVLKIIIGDAIFYFRVPHYIVSRFKTIFQ